MKKRNVKKPRGVGRLSEGGIRRRYRDDLKDCRAERPRRLPRGLDEYLSNAAARPLFGLHRAARASEHLMWLARYGKPAFRRFLGDAESLFFQVRAEQSNVLKSIGIEERPSKAALERLRNAVSAFASDCLALRAQMDVMHKTQCPCCHGTGRVYEITDRAVRAVLDKAVEDGILGYSRTEGYFGREKSGD